MATSKSTFQPLHQPLRFFAYMLQGVLCLLLAAGLTGCKKEESHLITVQVLSPNTNSSHTFGQSIEVAVKAESEIGIDKILISIKNENGHLAMPSRLIDINDETSVTRTIAFDLNDERLRSGNYYITATAYDTDEENKSDFRDIRIIGAPVVVEGIFALAQNNGTLLYQLNGDGSWSEVFSSSDLFHQMEINSYDQVIHLIGDATAGVLTISLDDFSTIRQEVIPFGLGNDFFTSAVLDTTSRKLYASAADNQLYIFNEAGQRQLSYSLPRSSALTIQNGALLAYSVQNITQKRLELYTAASGFFRQSFSVADEVVAITPSLNDGQFIYAANTENNEGILRVYDSENNYLDQWQSFLQNANTGAIIAAFRVESGVIVCHADALRNYTFIGADFSQNPLNLIALSEDKIGNRLYAASTNGVYQLDQQLNTLHFFALPNTLDIDVAYNK